jgi:hypothetical protein
MQEFLVFAEEGPRGFLATAKCQLDETLFSFMDGTPLIPVKKMDGHCKAVVITGIWGHAITRSQEKAAQKIGTVAAPLKIDRQQGCVRFYPENAVKEAYSLWGVR